MLNHQHWSNSISKDPPGDESDPVKKKIFCVTASIYHKIKLLRYENRNHDLTTRAEPLSNWIDHRQWRYCFIRTGLRLCLNTFLVGGGALYPAEIERIFDRTGLKRGIMSA